MPKRTVLPAFSIEWTITTLTILVLYMSPALARESAQPAQADRRAARLQEGNVRVLEHVSYGIEAPQAQVLNAYLV